MNFITNNLTTIIVVISSIVILKPIGVYLKKSKIRGNADKIQEKINKQKQLNAGNINFSFEHKRIEDEWMYNRQDTKYFDK